MMSDSTLYFRSVSEWVGLHLTGNLNTSIHFYILKNVCQDKT